MGTGFQEFNRYPSTVNRQPCFYLMQWCDRELTVFGMSHRTAPPKPLSLWEQELNRYPSTVSCQPCLSVSLDFSQQFIQCIRAWSFLNNLQVQHQFLKTLCVFKWSKCFERSAYFSLVFPLKLQLSVHHILGQSTGLVLFRLEVKTIILMICMSRQLFIFIMRRHQPRWV